MFAILFTQQSRPRTLATTNFIPIFDDRSKHANMSRNKACI